MLANVIAGASKDGSKECRIDLPTDQGYGETCVPARIDERSKCITSIAAPINCDLVQLGQQLKRELSILRSQTARETLDEPPMDAKGLHFARRPEKFAPLGAVDLIVFPRRPAMYLMFKNEMFHRSGYLAERIGNLCHGRYLPVEVPAFDDYASDMHLGLPRGSIDPHTSDDNTLMAVELELGAELNDVALTVSCPEIYSWKEGQGVVRLHVWLCLVKGNTYRNNVLKRMLDLRIP